MDYSKVQNFIKENEEELMVAGGVNDDKIKLYRNRS